MEFINQNILLIGVVVTSGLALAWQFLAKNAAGLNPAQVTLLINREDAVVLDVRETGEWSAGHIPNARHIAMGQLDKRIHELDKFKGRPIIVCCASGNRSSSACGRLKKAGFEKVFNLSGGIGAWTEAGLPTTTKG